MRTLGLLALLIAASSAAAEDLRELTDCVAAVEASSTVSDGPRLMAEHCPSACPGLARFPTEGALALKDGCGLFCSAKAETAFRAAPEGSARWNALESTCGRESYRLAKKGAVRLSAEWIVLERINAWLLHHQKGSVVEKKALEMIFAAPTLFYLPVPEMLPGRYALAESDDARDLNSDVLLLVEPDEVSVGIVPAARLTPKGLELTNAWPSFPGRATPLEGLAKVLASFEGEKNALGPRGEIRSLAPMQKRDGTDVIVLADSKLRVDRLRAVLEAAGPRRMGLAIRVASSSGQFWPMGVHILHLTSASELAPPRTNPLLVFKKGVSPPKPAPEPVNDLTLSSEQTVGDLVRTLDERAKQGVRLARLVRPVVDGSTKPAPR